MDCFFPSPLQEPTTTTTTTEPGLPSPSNVAGSIYISTETFVFAVYSEIYKSVFTFLCCEYRNVSDRGFLFLYICRNATGFGSSEAPEAARLCFFAESKEKLEYTVMKVCKLSPSVTQTESLVFVGHLIGPNVCLWLCQYRNVYVFFFQESSWSLFLF